jgi:lipocalin
MLMVSDKLDRCTEHASQTGTWLELAVFPRSLDKDFATMKFFHRRRAGGALIWTSNCYQAFLSKASIKQRGGSTTFE